MNKFISYIFAMIITTLLVILFLLASLTEREPAYVKCYDKFSNEIIGQTCLEKGYSLTTSEKFLLVLISNSAIIAFGVLYYYLILKEDD